MLSQEYCGRFVLSQEYCGRFVLSQEYSVFFFGFWFFFFLFQRCVLSQEYFGVAFGRFVLSQEHFGSLFFWSFFSGVAFFFRWFVLGQEYPAGGLCEAKSTPQRLVLSQEYSVIFVISVIFVTLVGVAFFLISRR